LELFDHVLAIRDQLGALLDQLVGGEADRLGHTARYEDFATELHRQARGDQWTAVLGALYDDNTQGQAGDDAVPNREIFGAGCVPSGNSLMIAPRSGTFS
jgi:hypothetical protein